MSNLSNAMELLDRIGCKKEGKLLRIGTVVSVSGDTATVNVAGVSVPAARFCECSAADRVLLLYEKPKYYVVGKKES